MSLIIGEASERVDVELHWIGGLAESHILSRPAKRHDLQVDYPQIERCWSSLEKKWNGVLLDRLKVVLRFAPRVTWKGRHPTVRRRNGVYPDGVHGVRLGIEILAGRDDAS